VPRLPRVTLTNSENDYDEDDMFWLRRKACNNFDKSKSTCSSWPISSVVITTPTKKINADEQKKSKKKKDKLNIIIIISNLFFFFFLFSSRKIT
jgi:hypothetical protein